MQEGKQEATASKTKQFEGKTTSRLVRFPCEVVAISIAVFALYK